MSTVEFKGRRAASEREEGTRLRIACLPVRSFTVYLDLLLELLFIAPFYSVFRWSSSGTEGPSSFLFSPLTYFW